MVDIGTFTEVKDLNTSTTTDNDTLCLSTNSAV